MSWARKINSKSYAFGTIVNLGFAIYAGLPSVFAAWWLTFVVISAVLNHYFTVKALSTLIEGRLETGRAASGLKLFLYFIFKTVFLASGFICLLVFARQKILQGLIVYIFQLIILGLSIKNIGNFFKKGTPS